MVGRRVVSVSKTPGHTKHFQTIFISPTVRLCDCPGLVFPSMVPRPFQVILGSYPIPQVRSVFLTFKFSLNSLRLYLTRETDTKIRRAKSWKFVNTVSPHIRPVGIIILCSLQLRVLLENTTFLLHKVIGIADIIRGRVLYEEIRYVIFCLKMIKCY